MSLGERYIIGRITLDADGRFHAMSGTSDLMINDSMWDVDRFQLQCQQYYVTCTEKNTLRTCIKERKIK